MGELESAFEELMDKAEKPGSQDFIRSVRFNRVWQSVNRSAAKVASRSIRQSLPSMDWWNKLRDKRVKAELAKSWEPFEATRLGTLSTMPRFKIQVKPLEAKRLEIDDATEEAILDAIADTLTEDTSWIGPVVNDAANPKPFYKYGNIA